MGGRECLFLRAPCVACCPPETPSQVSRCCKGTSPQSEGLVGCPCSHEGTPKRKHHLPAPCWGRCRWSMVGKGPPKWDMGRGDLDSARLQLDANAMGGGAWGRGLSPGGTGGGEKGGVPPPHGGGGQRVPEKPCWVPPRGALRSHFRAALLPFCCSPAIFLLC